MKEKKTFLKPEMKVVQLKRTGMICWSCGEVHDVCDAYTIPDNDCDY